MMENYLRTTRECTLNNMNPSLAAALRTYLVKNDLVEIEATALFCGETISTKEKKRFLLGKKLETVLTGIILNPKWLIWAVGHEYEEPSILDARLNMIQVEDYEESFMHEMAQDSGINVNGLHTGDGIGTVFIGLGPEPAAQKFREILKEAIKRA
ncbi:MAG: hypothetical protein GY943_06680 [Chloroflexi bacterium]|nr:hypothetical protein [Chloroflexota bacterium]